MENYLRIRERTNIPDIRNLSWFKTCLFGILMKKGNLKYFDFSYTRYTKNNKQKTNGDKYEG